MKRTAKIITLSIILVLLITFISFTISGFAITKPPYNPSHSWTKAICNETSCQDYQIFCDKDKLVKQTPITGAVIDMSENWTDPRNEGMKNRVCD